MMILVSGLLFVIFIATEINYMAEESLFSPFVINSRPVLLSSYRVNRQHVLLNRKISDKGCTHILNVLIKFEAYFMSLVYSV